MAEGLGHKWGDREKLLHPRGWHGRFRTTPDRIVNKILGFLDKFDPKTFPSDEAASNYVHDAARSDRRLTNARAEIDSFESGFSNINDGLRSGSLTPRQIETRNVIDAAMRPTPDPLILSQVLPPQSFGLEPQNLGDIQHSLEGMLISDKGYGSFNVGTPEPFDGPHVTMVAATPAGQKAVFPSVGRPTREVILPRDQPYRVTSIEPDGQHPGSYYMMVVAENDNMGAGAPNPEAPTQGFKQPEKAAQEATPSTPAPPAPPAPQPVPEQTPPAPAPAAAPPAPGGVQPRNEPIHAETVGAQPQAPAAPANPEPGAPTPPPAPTVPEAAPSKPNIRQLVRDNQIPIPSEGPRRRQWNNAYLGVASGKKHPEDMLRELRSDIANNKETLRKDAADGTDSGPLPNDIKAQEALANLIEHHFVPAKNQEHGNAPVPEAPAPEKKAARAAKKAAPEKAAAPAAKKAAPEKAAAPAAKKAAPAPAKATTATEPAASGKVKPLTARELTGTKSEELVQHVKDGRLTRNRAIAQLKEGIARQQDSLATRGYKRGDPAWQDNSTISKQTRAIDRDMQKNEGILKELEAMPARRAPVKAAEKAAPVKAPAKAVKAAKKAAPTTADLAGKNGLSPNTEIRKTQIENRIRQAYTDILKRHNKEPGDGEWVGLADLRDEIGTDIPRDQLDEVLRNYARGDSPLRKADGFRMIPVANSKALKPRDRAAAVLMGGEQNHAISIERPALRELPAAAAVKKAVPAKKAATPAAEKPFKFSRDVKEGEHVAFQPPGEKPTIGQVEKRGRFTYVKWDSGKEERVNVGKYQPNIRKATADEAKGFSFPEKPAAPAKAPRLTAEDRARLKQGQIDKARANSHLVSQLDSDIHLGASERAIRSHINSLSGQGGEHISGEDKAALLSKAGNPEGLKQELNRIFGEHKLGTVGGKPGEKVPFSRKTMEGMGGERLREGQPVEIHRSGHETTLPTGSKVQLSKAQVQGVEPGPEHTAVAKKAATEAVKGDALSARHKLWGETFKNAGTELPPEGTPSGDAAREAINGADSPEGIRRAATKFDLIAKDLRKKSDDNLKQGEPENARAAELQLKRANDLEKAAQVMRDIAGKRRSSKTAPAAAKPDEDLLKSSTVPTIRAYANEKGIKIPNSIRRKDDLIAHIRAAETEKQAAIKDIGKAVPEAQIETKVHEFVDPVSGEKVIGVEFPADIHKKLMSATPQQLRESAKTVGIHVPPSIKSRSAILEHVMTQMVINEHKSQLERQAAKAAKKTTKAITKATEAATPPKLSLRTAMKEAGVGRPESIGANRSLHSAAEDLMKGEDPKKVAQKLRKDAAELLKSNGGEGDKVRRAEGAKALRDTAAKLEEQAKAAAPAAKAAAPAAKAAAPAAKAAKATPPKVQAMSNPDVVKQTKDVLANAKSAEEAKQFIRNQKLTITQIRELMKETKIEPGNARTKEDLISAFGHHVQSRIDFGVLTHGGMRGEGLGDPGIAKQVTKAAENLATARSDKPLIPNTWDGGGGRGRRSDPLP